MDSDEAPLPASPIPGNDNAQMPVPSAKVDAALKFIARLIGRQMAREAFESKQVANDNDTG